MKNLVKQSLVLLVLCALTSVAALAKTTAKEVTFDRAVTVNGSLVKAGTYKVVFDDQTGELTIFNGRKTVAKAPARLEKLQGSPGIVYRAKTEADSNILLAVTLKGGNQAALVNDSDGRGEEAQ